MWLLLRVVLRHVQWFIFQLSITYCGGLLLQLHLSRYLPAVFPEVKYKSYRDLHITFRRLAASTELTTTYVTLQSVKVHLSFTHVWKKKKFSNHCKWITTDRLMCVAPGKEYSLVHFFRRWWCKSTCFLPREVPYFGNESNEFGRSKTAFMRKDQFVAWFDGTEVPLQKYCAQPKTNALQKLLFAADVFLFSKWSFPRMPECVWTWLQIATLDACSRSIFLMEISTLVASLLLPVITQKTPFTKIRDAASLYLFPSKVIFVFKAFNKRSTTQHLRIII